MQSFCHIFITVCVSIKGISWGQWREEISLLEIVTRTRREISKTGNLPQRQLSKEGFP